MNIRKVTASAVTALSLAALPMATLAANDVDDGGKGNHRGQSVEFHQDKGKSAQHFRGAQDRDNQEGVEENDGDDTTTSDQHIIFPDTDDTSTATPSGAAQDGLVKANVKVNDPEGNRMKFSFKGTLDQFSQFLSSILSSLHLS